MNQDNAEIVETPVANEAITAEIGATTIAPAADDQIVASAVTNQPQEEGEQKEQEQIAPLTYKEMKALKKARYEDIMENKRFKNSYLLKNVRTSQMVEVRAASSFHACNIIGWKHKQVKLIKVTPIEDKAPETASSSSAPVATA